MIMFYGDICCLREYEKTVFIKVNSSTQSVSDHHLLIAWTLSLSTQFCTLLNMSCHPTFMWYYCNSFKRCVHLITYSCVDMFECANQYKSHDQPKPNVALMFSYIIHYIWLFFYLYLYNINNKLSIQHSCICTMILIMIMCTLLNIHTIMCHTCTYFRNFSQWKLSCL